jgi:hypothetical protein
MKLIQGQLLTPPHSLISFSNLAFKLFAIVIGFVNCMDGYGQTNVQTNSGASATNFVAYFNNGGSHLIDLTNMKYNGLDKFQVFYPPAPIATWPNPNARFEVDEQGIGFIGYKVTGCQSNWNVELQQYISAPSSYTFSGARADYHFLHAADVCETQDNLDGLALTMTDRSTNQTDAYFVQKDGYIGIGNQHPKASLHIWTDAISRHGVPTTGATGELLVGEKNYAFPTSGTVKTFGLLNGYYFADRSWDGITTAVAGSYFNWYSDLGKAYLWTPNKQNLITVDGPSGMVTIGLPTGNLNNMLVVHGRICAKELNITLNSDPCVWADYVFDKKFELRTLSELEKYVGEYKHLPNIPSSSDIVKNGLNIGLVEAKTVENVEELTLYVIQLDKELKKLKKENEKLAAQIKSIKKANN